jgi:phosphatidate cytidylyltransferase
MFLARLVTAVVLLAVCVGGIFFLPNVWWSGLLLPALFAAACEWAALSRFNNRAQRWGFIGFVIASAAAVRFAGPVYFPGGATVLYAVGCTFWVLVAVPWLAFAWRVESALAMGLAGWALLVPAWLAVAQLQAEPQKLLALLGIIWISDTAAYAAGRAWGRHKLAPSISPGKTWEGVAGAVVAVAVYYVALSTAAPQWDWWASPGGPLLFGAVMLAGVAGDLFESWIKRQAGIKDSGTLLPGHGGVLDRIDSMTASLPIAALLLPYIS